MAQDKSCSGQKHLVRPEGKEETGRGLFRCSKAEDMVMVMMMMMSSSALL